MVNNMVAYKTLVLLPPSFYTLSSADETVKAVSHLHRHVLCGSDDGLNRLFTRLIFLGWGVKSCDMLSVPSERALVESFWHLLPILTRFQFTHLNTDGESADTAFDSSLIVSWQWWSACNCFKYTLFKKQLIASIAMMLVWQEEGNKS